MAITRCSPSLRIPDGLADSDTTSWCFVFPFCPIFFIWTGAHNRPNRFISSVRFVMSCSVTASSINSDPRRVIALVSRALSQFLRLTSRFF